MKTLLALMIGLLSIYANADVIGHDLTLAELAPGSKLVFKTGLKLMAQTNRFSAIDRLTAVKLISNRGADVPVLTDGSRYHRATTCNVEASRVRDGRQLADFKISDKTVFTIKSVRPLQICEERSSCVPTVLLTLEKQDIGLLGDQLLISCSKPLHWSGRTSYAEALEMTLKDIRDALNWTIYFKG